jgi:hypothetical protein
MRRDVWRVEGREASAVHGNVVWAPAKSVWNSSMYIGAIALAPWHFSWSAFAVFLALSYPTLLLGHSLGMNRRLIHRTFDCPKPLERILVWLGVLVGMAGRTENYDYQVQRATDSCICLRRSFNGVISRPIVSRVDRHPSLASRATAWQADSLREQCRGRRRQTRLLDIPGEYVAVSGLPKPPRAPPSAAST